MFFSLRPNHTLNPASIIKLRVPPLNVFVNDPSVFLECKLCVIVNFMTDELVADLLFLVEVLLTEFFEDRAEEKLLN